MYFDSPSGGPSICVPSTDLYNFGLQILRAWTHPSKPRVTQYRERRQRFRVLQCSEREGGLRFCSALSICVCICFCGYGDDDCAHRLELASSITDDHGASSGLAAQECGQDARSRAECPRNSSCWESCAGDGAESCQNWYRRVFWVVWSACAHCDRCRPSARCHSSLSSSRGAVASCQLFFFFPPWVGQSYSYIYSSCLHVFALVSLWILPLGFLGFRFFFPFSYFLFLSYMHNIDTQILPTLDRWHTSDGILHPSHCLLSTLCSAMQFCLEEKVWVVKTTMQVAVCFAVWLNILASSSVKLGKAQNGLSVSSGMWLPCATAYHHSPINWEVTEKEQQQRWIMLVA